MKWTWTDTGFAILFLFLFALTIIQSWRRAELQVEVNALRLELPSQLVIVDSIGVIVGGTVDFVPCYILKEDIR